MEEEDLLPEIVLTEGDLIPDHPMVSTEDAEDVQTQERKDTEIGIGSGRTRRASEGTEIVLDQGRRSTRRGDKADQTLQESDSRASEPDLYQATSFKPTPNFYSSSINQIK